MLIPKYKIKCPQAYLKYASQKVQTENQITTRKGNKNALEVCLFIYGLNERERESERERVEYGGYIYDIIYM